MGWNATQYKQVRKEPRHARVSLSVVRCVDCERQLQQTHQVVRYGGRCRPCWEALELVLPDGGRVLFDYCCEG